MKTKNLVSSRLSRASLGVLACGVIAALGASCGSTQDCQPGVSSKLVSGKLTQSSTRRVDLLLTIDNSRSMADKQQILALAVPDLVRGLVNPPCIDHNTGLVVATPASPLDACPTGAERKIDPLTDIHVGIVSSSLGGHGSDACASSGAGKSSNNDQAHLLYRKDPTTTQKLETYQNLGFLAWDPEQKLSPPGEVDIDADTGADPNSIALVPQLRDMVLGVGQIGCGYEATLESWYRFLVDPSPAESVELDADQKVKLVGVDTVLLDQRKSFLRPDSLLAILMLSDENDCSIRESGQFYFAAQQKTEDGSPFHLPKARAICDTDPNNECCFSCGQSGPKNEDGSLKCDADPTCKTPDGKTAYLDESTDNINLRCFNQKRRFGIDFLYSIDRYTKALRDSTVADRNGQVVPNPLFSDLDPSDSNANVRTSSMVMLAAITGVPWQDIARTNANGQPDLKAGLNIYGSPVGGFKSAYEMDDPLPGTDFTGWDLVLGDPDSYPAADALPKDPLMLESVEPRTGTNPITGEALAPPSSPLANKINGNEWTIPKRDDLQYACIFPLVKVDPATGAIGPDTRDCSVPGTYAGCDCEDKTNDNPLCQQAASGAPTDQVRAKAYPGLRELAVVRSLGGQGIVGSVCPAQVNKPEDIDFGYRPAIAALLDRLVPAADTQCLQLTLPTDESGQVECLIIEAQRVENAQISGCNACDGGGRTIVSNQHQGAVDGITEDNPSAAYNCFCEIPQLSDSTPGGALYACQNDPAKNPVLADGTPVDGYCYVDADANVGNPEIVEKCGVSERRLIRFVGEGEPENGSTVFITCVVEKANGSGAACP